MNKLKTILIFTIDGSRVIKEYNATEGWTLQCIKYSNENFYTIYEEKGKNTFFKDTYERRTIAELPYKQYLMEYKYES